MRAPIDIIGDQQPNRGEPSTLSKHVSFDVMSLDDTSLSEDSSTSVSDDKSYGDISVSIGDQLDLENREFPPTLPTAAAPRSFVSRRRKAITQRISQDLSNKFEHNEIPEGSIVTATDDGVNDLWRRLKYLRVKVARLRELARQKRRDVWDARQKKDVADNAMMHLLRPILTSHNYEKLSYAMQTLEARFAEMQKTRNQFHHAEAECEDLERELDDAEKELSAIETRFWSALVDQQQARTHGVDEARYEDDGDKPPPDLPEPLLGISANGPPDDVHPLYEQFTEAIGYMTNAREFLLEFLSFKESMQSTIDMKLRTSRDLSEEELEFVKENAEEEAEKTQAVERWEAEVGRLKDLCIKKGALKRHPSVKIAQLLDPSLGDDDLFLEDKKLIQEAHKSMSHRLFPELLSQPEHVLLDPPRTPFAALREATKLPRNVGNNNERLTVALKEYGIDVTIRDYTGESKTEFVSRWLLHQLRSSPQSVLLLHGIFLQEIEKSGLQVLDSATWQADVLYFWWRDGAVDAEEPYLGPESLDVFHTIALTEGRTEAISRAASDEALFQRKRTTWVLEHDTASNP